MASSLLTFRRSLPLVLALVSVLAPACSDSEDPNETSKETPPAEETGPIEETLPVGAPSIVVTPTTGLRTTEGGGIATFTVVLTLMPKSDVTIGLTSSNEAEGKVDKPRIVFTSDNWNAPQTITITGVDDTNADGAQDYKIVTAPATSPDPLYEALNADDVSVTNTDDDSPGVSVTPITGLKTSEMGDEATFAVRLNTKPTGDVTIGISSSNEKEGVVSPKSLVFTTLNWNAPQTVTVTGVDDAVADGTQTYKIITAPATSSDTTYKGVDGDDVTVVNVDDESPGVTVKPTTGLSTTEAGGTAVFTVRLNSKPMADVIIPISSSRVAEGTVPPAPLTFTADNWNAPQTVTVTGVDDSAADGNQTYKIVLGAATSADKGYTSIDPEDVTLTNVDDESAGFTVTPTSGLITTEGGGTATFTIRLNSKPNGTVTVGLTSTNAKEGTVSPASVSFTADNWNAPRVVTLTGVEDAVADGNQPFKIVTGVATGTDTSGYVGLDPTDVSATNTDNDSAGFTIIPPTANTTESGGVTSFGVKLNSQPTGSVTIPLLSVDTTEGIISTSSLTFDGTTWNTPQYVTVTGVDDFVADGAQLYSVQLGAVTGSDTSGYLGMNPPDVSLSNTDNDSPGVTLSTTAGLVTTEAGGTATFTVKLNSQPTANVTIPLTSSNTAEGTVSPTSLTFNATNWNVAQTVTMKGVDDFVADSDQVYFARTGAASSTDTGYNLFNAADVSLTNTDNDAAGIVVTPTTGLVTSEWGQTASFTVVLTSAPLATVTIPISSSNLAEGVVSATSLTFNSTTWNVAQTVTVKGVDDTIVDTDVAYTIFTGLATSTDAKYSGMNAADVSVTNLNDDKAVDCTITVCGQTCAEINKAYPTLPSGNYLIQTPVTKPFTVYCDGMEFLKAPKNEYLNVNSKVNYSTFAGEGSCTTCGDLTTYYTKIRFFPATLSIDTRDQKFTKPASSLGIDYAACYAKYSCTGYALNYGSAGACASVAGSGSVDLAPNPFAVSDKALVQGTGYKPSGAMSFTLDRKGASVRGGGGLCGSYGFADGALGYPVGTGSLPLIWAP